MPIHDWTRVSTGIFHDFLQDWTIEIRRCLNRGSLAPGWYVDVPLEETCRTSWDVTPGPIRDLLLAPLSQERPGT
jgi:hypothetical protein